MSRNGGGVGEMTKKERRRLTLWPDEIRPGVVIEVQAGVVERRGPMDRFIGTVDAGTRGAYVGPHPTPSLARDGWHLVDVLDGYVPLHRSQFRRSAQRGGR